MSENNMTMIDTVRAALAGDRDTFQSGIESAIAGKVGDALEAKKVEVESTLLMPSTEEPTHEVKDS